MWTGVLRTRVIIGAGLLALFSAAYGIYLHVTAEQHSIGREVRSATQHVQSVIALEQHCFSLEHRYFDLRSADDRCSREALLTAIRRAEEDGYTIDIHAETSGYAVRLRPASTTRIVTVYSDHTGSFRIATLK